jgi:hypothetical protein
MDEAAENRIPNGGEQASGNLPKFNCTEAACKHL